jgi:hypothetical protein
MTAERRISDEPVEASGGASQHDDDVLKAQMQFCAIGAVERDSLAERFFGARLLFLAKSH